MIEKLPHYSYEAENKGPHLLVLGAIHGDEQCGTYALTRLKFELDNGISELCAGKLTLAPACNPVAYKANKRFVEKNLNRIISPQAKGDTFEHTYARQVIKLIHEADYVLDLHSYDSGGLPFVFLDYPTQANFDFVGALGIRHCVTGWPEMFENSADLSEGDTLTYAFSQGKVGCVVECGLHNDPASILIADKCIRNTLSYLQIMGSQKSDIADVCMEFHQAKSIVVKERDGHFSKAWKHLDAIRKDECLAIYSDGGKVISPFDGVVLLPNEKKMSGEEWFYLGEKVSKPALRLG